MIKWYAPTLYNIDRKSRRWLVRLFVNFLDAKMVNAYIFYKQNFKIMNMPKPQKPSKPMGHDKCMAKYYPQADW
jgi:hypothetical protein